MTLSWILCLFSPRRFQLKQRSREWSKGKESSRDAHHFYRQLGHGIMRDLLTRISPQNIWRFLAAKFRNFYSLILWGIQSRPASTPVLLPKTLFLGSTANFFRVRPGVVLKSPTTIGFDQTPQVDPSVEKHFHAEKRILEHLGRSPQIVEYEPVRLVRTALIANILSKIPRLEILISNWPSI